MQSFHGQLEGLLLAILQQGPRHGYAIASELRARSDGALEVPEGTLYPVLHKLEKQGLVRSHWERSAAAQTRVRRVTQEPDCGPGALRELAAPESRD